MIIYMSPQVPNNEEEFEYSFDGEKIDIKLITKEEIYQDTFDLSTVPNGRLELSSVETTLPLNPILEAERIEGELQVVLKNYIDEEATEEEKFPKWIDPSQYSPSKVREKGIRQNGEL